MDCLEVNLSSLESTACREAVVKNAEDVAQNPELDKIFAQSCKEFWLKYCKVGGNELSCCVESLIAVM